MPTVIAFSTGPRAAAEEPPKAAPQLSRWDMHPKPPVVEELPVFATTEEAAEATDSPAEAVPSAEMPEPTPPRRPLIRVLFLLAFFLFPVISSFVRNWRSFRQQSAQPVLRELLVGEGPAQGDPLQPRNTFSLRQDRAIAVSSRWTGASEGHTFTVTWNPQEGGRKNMAGYPGSQVLVRRENNSGFSVSGTLPLRSEMPAGIWAAELEMDGATRGKVEFTLEK